VSGQRAVSDPDTLDSESLLGRVVVLQVAQAPGVGPHERDEPRLE